MMKKGQELVVDIEKLAYGGKGIARFDNQVVFVEGGIPGDRVEVRIRKIKKNYSDARLIKLVKSSSLRQSAPCSHFGFCGGCKWQNLEYQEQLRFKREQIVESLIHLADAKVVKVHPTLPSPLIFSYRNKMEFSFTDNRWLTPIQLSDPAISKGFALGLHVPGSFDRVMQIEKCWLQDDIMNNILRRAYDYFKKSELPVFNLKTHQGLVRFLVIRKSFSYPEYMVNIVTFKEATETLSEFARLLVREIPPIKSVINTVNPRFAQIAFGEEEHVLFGSNHIREKIGDFTFTISANSFFQTNTLQAENLYHVVQKFAGSGSGLIWDLYSGTGTIAMFLSRIARRVVGFELVESSLRDAEQNCRQNQITNCEFVAGDIRNNILYRNDIPDVVVTDPPRSGMHPDIVNTLLDIRPSAIIYVSCNPTTMARDIKPLLPFYQLKEIQPVDMFPHTYHIESVIRLELI
jgi:23S rRNA (uracil1939-C5)-methyltransferase